MDEKRYRLPGAPVFSVPAADAERLVALGDGEAALLYIYILQSGGELSVARAARALNRSEEVIRRSVAQLGRAGILSESERKLPQSADDPPEYTAGDIVRRSREDGTFQALVAEAQQVLGHSLSTPDLKTLFGIYDRLGMPPDVIMLLFHHCAERLRRRYGEGRLPTMRTVEKEAIHWVNREILTLEQAEEYLAALSRREQESFRVREAMGVQHRDLTPTEQKYLDGWLELGYRADTLAIAYDRTVVSTGKLAWAYMNKIVQDWYSKGLFTPEDIEAKDSRGPKKTAAVPQPRPAYSGGDDLRIFETQFLNNTKE